MAIAFGSKQHTEALRGMRRARGHRLVVLTACSAFKLAIVLGPSRVAGKLRVQTYSHAARGWSNPHTVPESDTRTATVALLQGGQRRTLMHALVDGEHLGAWCHTA